MKLECESVLGTGKWAAQGPETTASSSTAIRAFITNFGGTGVGRVAHSRHSSGAEGDLLEHIGVRSSARLWRNWHLARAWMVGRWLGQTSSAVS